MKSWNELKSAVDALEYCKAVFAPYKDQMSKEEKEKIASILLAFSFSDHFQEWSGKYPVFERIEAYASDLEWSNSVDIEGDWEKLKSYIEELDRQLHNSSRPNLAK